MIPNKLSHAIRTDITERFVDGEAFTSFDFYALCEKYGKPVKSATHVLRDMALKGLLECVGEQANKHGGGARLPDRSHQARTGHEPRQPRHASRAGQDDAQRGALCLTWR